MSVIGGRGMEGGGRGGVLRAASRKVCREDRVLIVCTHLHD